MHRVELLNLLADYRTTYMEEAAYLSRAKEFVQVHESVFERDLYPAHVTGSAWVVNPQRTAVLMLLHRKHNQWFQPGGHADGEADILAVALRETTEETGIAPDKIRLVDANIFDLDIHTIPAIGSFPQHEHIDVRFLLEIDDSLPVPGNDESHDIRWLPLNTVARFNNNRSTHRMVDKTRRLRSWN